jgi:hypothetical protein
VTRFPPIRRPKYVPSLVAAACGVGLSWALSLLFAVLAARWAGEDAAFSVAIIVACVVTVPIVARRMRRSDGESPVRAVALALLGWALYLFLGATRALESSAAPGCRTGDVGILVILAISAPFVFGLTLAIAKALDRFRLRLATRCVAYAALGLSVLTLAVSLRRIHDATPEGYVESLPVLGTLGLTDHFDRPGFSVTTDWRPLGGDFSKKSWPYLDPQVNKGCQITVRGSVVSTDLASLPSCVGVRVRRDAARDTWVVQAPSGGSYAIDDQAHARKIVTSRPPTAWVASLGAGTLLALVAMIIAYIVQTRADAWRAARPGQHRGGGWVAFEDGTPPTHLAAATNLCIGFILVLEPSRLTPSYREHGRVEEGARLVGGSLDNLLEVAEARATDLYVFASLVALLTLAPMLAAALARLLG